MGFLDRIRSGLRSIGERLHLIGPKVGPETRKEIESLERKVDRMERSTRPEERTVRERFAPEPGPNRYHVVIRYRPVLASRRTRTRSAVVEAGSADEAIAIVQAELDDEPGYYLSIDSERTDGPVRDAHEGPSRGT